MGEFQEAAVDGEVVQHPILRQQRATCIQQFVEDFDVGNPRMLGCQKYKRNRPPTQAQAELPHEGDSWPTHSSTTTRSMRFMIGPANRFGIGTWSTAPLWPSCCSVDVFDATTPGLWQPLPGVP